LAVDDDEINLKLVSATLSRAGYEIFTAANGAETLRRVEEIRPDVILLDVMMPEMDGYEVCNRLRQRAATAHIPIMMLTALDTVEEKIKGFEAGADDYLPKPFAPDELQARVRVLLRRAAAVPAPPAQALGKVIAVYSLRGGVGVSSVAANLVAALAQLWGQGPTLVDLAFNAGQSALMLNLPFRHTWADLAPIPTADLEMDLLRQILLQHASGAQVLAASPRPEQNEQLTAAKVARVLHLLAEGVPYVMLDLPHDFSETTLAGLDAADEILLLLAPELASVRSTVCALDVFAKLDYPPEKVRLLLNWTFQKNGLARKDIEAAIKRPIDLVIPYAAEAMVAAINLGRPPVLSDPNAPLASLFEDLAFLLSADAQKKQRPAAPSDTWKRVVSRIQQRQQRR
jgi:pilus assembly protein CpaE